MKRNNAVANDNAQSFKSMMFEEVIANNPVLVGTIGICPVVAICTSLKSALLMSVVTMLTMIVAQCLSATVIKRVSPWIRVALYTLSGMLIVAPSMLVLDIVSPATALALGIYLPLLAVNPLIVRQCERVGVKSTISAAFKNAVCCSLGYDAVLILVGVIREIFGSGKIWGHQIINHPMKALNMPLGGFILIGLFAALLHVYFKHSDPLYAEEMAVHSRAAIKKPKGQKPEDKTEEKTIEKEITVKEEIVETNEEIIKEEVIKEETVEEKAADEKAVDENPEDKTVAEKTETVEIKATVKKEKGKIVQKSDEVDELLSASIDDLLSEAEETLKKEGDDK